MPDQYFVSHGAHRTRADGMCAMEWVAYLAGEEHSDSPVCVDPVLRRFGIGLNDALPNGLRQRLRPFLARMIGTADDGLGEQRMFMVADWAVRVAAPMGLEAAGCGESAAGLRELAPVVDAASAADATATAAAAAHVTDAAAVAHVTAAADAAYAAADATATAAAYAAATAAAHAAHAAHAAAYADAIGISGWEWLLPSALELLDRMLPTEPIRLPVAADAERVCMLEPIQREGVTIA